MSKCTVRRLATAAMYLGVLIFLYPYFSGHVSTGALFLIGGAGLAIFCGLLRCFCLEGDSAEQNIRNKISL